MRKIFKEVFSEFLYHYTSTYMWVFERMTMLSHEEILMCVRMNIHRIKLCR